MYELRISRTAESNSVSKWTRKFKEKNLHVTSEMLDKRIAVLLHDRGESGLGEVTCLNPVGKLAMPDAVMTWFGRSVTAFLVKQYTHL